MNANVGMVDRWIRVIVGLILLSLLFILEGNHKWWGLLGFIPLLTAAIKWCPLYTLFGIRTCPAKKE